MILYRNFYTPDGKELSIGGIQTYIKMLIKVIKKNNMLPIIYQYSDVDFHNKYDGIDVFGIKMEKKWKEKKKKQMLFLRGNESLNPNQDILLFGCETLVVKNNIKHVVGIQHGISWDIRSHEKFNSTQNILYGYLKAFRAMTLVKRIRNVKHLVGVDYNFLNWYRTQLAYTEVKVDIIPNSIEVDDFEKHDSKDNLNIIFARRFKSQRGTRLFANVIDRLTQKYDQLNVSFAGEGPDEKYLKERFIKNKSVNFIKYNSTESLEIHKKYDIAVIPTIGSEGTSFSLLESMAAKCAVIASNVGGMTNIILDNYNGLLINPEEESLYNAMEKLIEDEVLRKKLATNAFKTVLNSFNRDLWEERWTEVFESVIK